MLILQNIWRQASEFLTDSTSFPDIFRLQYQEECYKILKSLNPNIFFVCPEMCVCEILFLKLFFLSPAVSIEIQLFVFITLPKVMNYLSLLRSNLCKFRNHHAVFIVIFQYPYLGSSWSRDKMDLKSMISMNCLSMRSYWGFLMKNKPQKMSDNSIKLF